MLRSRPLLNRDQGRVARAPVANAFIPPRRRCRPRHADLRLIGQTLDRAEQPSLHVGLGFAMTRTPSCAWPSTSTGRARSARRRSRKSRKYQQATESAPGQTHAETCSMMKIPKLSSANTQVRHKEQEMRFMSLFFGETNRNIGKANHNMVRG